VRPGGVWRHVMHCLDGTDYQNKIVYVEVVKHERIVYDHVSPPAFRVTDRDIHRPGRQDGDLHAQWSFESAALRDKIRPKEHGAVRGFAPDTGTPGGAFGKHGRSGKSWRERFARARE